MKGGRYPALLWGVSIVLALLLIHILYSSFSHDSIPISSILRPSTSLTNTSLPFAIPISSPLSSSTLTSTSPPSSTVTSASLSLSTCVSVSPPRSSLASEFIRLPTADRFPRKIWQSWRDDAEDPTDRTVGFPHAWRAMHPNHRYERLLDSNANAYVLDNFSPNISSVFTSMTDQVMRADLLRYLIVLKEGGLWADIDTRPWRKIEDWIPNSYAQQEINLVVGIENDHNKAPIWPGIPYSVQLAQYVILAKPNHPALATLVGSVVQGLESLYDAKQSWSTVTFEEVMTITGPFAFTKALMDYFDFITGEEHNGDELHGIQEPRLIGDVLVLPMENFGSLGEFDGHEEGRFVQHLFQGSWRDGHP